MLDSPAAIAALLQLVHNEQIEWDLQITQRMVAAHRGLRDQGDEIAAAELAVAWGHAALDVDSTALADALCVRAEACLPGLTEAMVLDVGRLRARIPTVVPLGLTLIQAREAFDARDEIPFSVLHATAVMFPDWSALLGSVAWHWARRGLFEEAEDLFRAGLLRAPHDGSMLWGLGLALLSRDADDRLEALLDELQPTLAQGLAEPAKRQNEEAGCGEPGPQAQRGRVCPDAASGRRGNSFTALGSSPDGSVERSAERAERQNEEAGCGEPGPQAQRGRVYPNAARLLRERLVARKS